MSGARGTAGAFDDAQLNAYVDGELTPAAAAEIARRAANDPALAARIARLHRLKAAVAESFAPDLDTLPAMPAPRPAASRPTPRRLRVALGLVAGLVLAVAAGAWLHTPRPALQPEVAVHDAWAESETEAAAEAPIWLTAVIEATGLRLARVAPLRSHDGRAGVHYAFVGTNQCRLSLFEMPAARTGDSALTLLVQGNLRSAHWRAGGQGYLVIARDMDGARFATIAAALNEATITRRTPEPARLALLRAARQRCLT
jgi:anti-sigma factor RsiW